MYITVASIKRNLGFKGIEVKDLIIALPFGIVFLIMFCFTNLKILSLSVLIIGFFTLIPVKISQKNRMYKVLILLINYLFRVKSYIYSNK